MSLKTIIKETLIDFSDIISDYKVLLDKNENNRVIIYLKIDLSNDELLFSRDILVALPNGSLKRKYAYQYG